MCATTIRSDHQNCSSDKTMNKSNKIKKIAAKLHRSDNN